MTKTFTISQWKAMAIVAQPTATTAMIRQDADGNRWQWKASGKRVEAKKV
jgi:hypothetical protein